MSVGATTMSSSIASLLGASTNNTVHATALPVVESLLEATIPGFSIFSGLFRAYFAVDLAAVVSSVLPLAAVIAAFRYAYAPLYGYLLAYGVSTAEIRNDDEMFEYLMFWVAQSQLSSKSRSFIANTRNKGDPMYDTSNDSSGVQQTQEQCDWELAEKDFDSYWAIVTSRDKVRPICCLPCEGTHYFRYKGQRLAFTRETSDQAIGRYIEKREIIRISCTGRNPTILKELLREAQQMYLERDGSKTIIYRKWPDDDYWQRCMARTPRPLSSVVLDHKQKDALVADIKEYLHPRTKRWYANRGIPYRRGYLLYGPPGTGKTSLCVAIAGMFGLKVYVTSLNSRSLTEESLGTLFNYLPERCVVLLEDVDTAGITHSRDSDGTQTTGKDKADTALDAKDSASKTTSASGITLSGLLNVIDGVASSEGRILIMTTNHAEKLDPALLRPGRVDMSIGFENASTATMEELFKSTYISRDDDYPVSPKYNLGNPGKPRNFFARTLGFTDEQVSELATKFANQVPSGEFSPADIQGYLLKHKLTPGEAAEEVSEWVVKTREEKRKQKKQGTNSSSSSDTPIVV